MALIKCSECGKEYSDKAKCCPNCACPTRYNIHIDEEEGASEREIPVSDDDQDNMEELDSEYLELLRRPRKPSIAVPVFMTLAAIACVAFAVVNYTVIMKDRNPVLMLVLLIFAAAVLVAVSIAFYMQRIRKYNRLMEEYKSQEKVEDNARPKHIR